MSDTPRWWALSETALRGALERARSGDHPDVILAELYANSDTEAVEDDE